MPVPSTPEDSRAIIVLILILATLGVIYWRLAIRLLVIVMIAMAVYGVVATLHL
jgi:hypothetical protein